MKTILRTVYGHLVRDEEPGKLIAEGHRIRTSVIPPGKRLTLHARRKVLQVAEELQRVKNRRETIEKMADLLEAIKSLARKSGIEKREVTKAENRRRKTHGSIGNIFLYTIEDIPKKK